jgi:hypothetical protein
MKPKKTRKPPKKAPKRRPRPGYRDVVAWTVNRLIDAGGVGPIPVAIVDLVGDLWQRGTTQFHADVTALYETRYTLSRLSGGTGGVRPLRYL